MKYLYGKYKGSLNFKITLSTFFIVILGIVTIISYTQLNVNKLTNKTLETMNVKLTDLTDDFYLNYLNEVSGKMDSEYSNYVHEIEILGNMVQNIFDHTDEFAPVFEKLKDIPYFQDTLINNGKWVQNGSDELSTVFLGRYLLDDQGKVLPNVQKLIDQTAIMDIFLPSFANYGSDKMQIYFTGGENLDFTRMSPWVNIGKSVYDVYPELYDLPIWQTFNPGLIEDWTNLMFKWGVGSSSLIRTGAPVQDGITGEMNIGLTYPIWDREKSVFIGEIAYDIPLNHLIDYIKKVKLNASGFAMLIQSSGNVFGINDNGLKTMGFKDNDESTMVTATGFNSLTRTFKDSSIEDVKSIVIEENSGFKEITIEGKVYLLIAKKMNPFMYWDTEKGFYNDSWTLAFMIPKDEVFQMFYSSEKQLHSDSINSLKELLLIAVLITFFVLAFIVLYNSKLTRQLNQLTEKVKGMKSSHYTTEFDIDSEDEIGKLSDAFGEMQVEIKETINQLNVQNDQLKFEIDERIKKDRIIDYLENFDSQTDLLNKKALLNILKEMDVTEEYSYLTLIAIGIDDLRKINDAYNYKIGDEVIQVIAIRLESIVEDKDLLFRIGGDEFGVLFRTHNLDELILICDSIFDLFKQAVNTTAQEIGVSCSLGVSTYPNDMEETIDLFKCANVALNHAKEGVRGGYAFYSEHMNDKARVRLDFINELNHAVERGEFTMHFQPIIEMESLNIIGVEALIRWNNETLGFVAPDIFIPIAEETNQIIFIGQWVIEECFKQLIVLEKNGFGKLSMAINISVIQFVQIDFVDKVKMLIEQYGIDASKIIFEVTEGLFLNDFKKASIVISELMALGLQLSIDDFGTGYSSLSYLKNLHINHLKIDKSFVFELNDKTGGEIVNAILALANSLNLNVIAEGVETQEQFNYLQEKGCNEAQGYLFSKPLGIIDLLKWLNDFETNR